MQTDPGIQRRVGWGGAVLGRDAGTESWGLRGPGCGVAECKPTREIQRPVHRGGATLGRCRHGKLGRAGRATKLLNGNRAGEFNGGCAGLVRPWTDAGTKN